MFKYPFSFNGRIRRTEYGITFIIYVFVYVATLLAIDAGGTAAVLLIIPTVWLLWAQGAKRCHDVGNSGWFQFIPLYFLWLIFKEGEIGENAYGEDPKSEGENQNNS